MLIGDWDVVFLDEPTNHLDMEGVAWLAAHLKKRWPANQGGLVVVTHDRWFLDEVSTDTWEVHDRIIEPFEGGYAAYVLQRVERDRSAAASESKRRNLMRKELAWLRRGAPARTTKPKFRMDAAAALIANEPPVRDSVSLSQLAVDAARQGRRRPAGRLGRVPVGDDAARPTKVLHDVEWLIAPGERTGILGVNGAGKSTLLGLIAGTVSRPSAGSSAARPCGSPSSTRTRRARRVRRRAGQRRGRPAEVELRERRPAELTPGQLLERLGFTSAQLSTPVKDLSGGQKRRLQLLLILLDEPNVLILDEPTNDLDTDMLAAMEDLLDSWPGTLLVVSHDRYLIERVTDQQYAILDRRLRHLPGGVEEYLELRRQQSDAGGGAASAEASRPIAAGGAAPRPTPRRRGFETSGARAAAPAALAGAERRDAEKELLVDRPSAREAAGADRGAAQKLARHDQGDYVGLGVSATNSAGSRRPSPSSRPAGSRVGGPRGLKGRARPSFVLNASKHPSRSRNLLEGTVTVVTCARSERRSFA